MRIATWNLARPKTNGLRTSRLLALISEQNADVWVLTETRLSVSPGSDYLRVACSLQAADLVEDERWVAIWIRKEAEFEPVEWADAERAACVRMVTSTGQPLFVYGTVLPWLGDQSGRQLKGSARFKAALDTQQGDWRRLLDSEPGAGLCVAGDMNQDLLLTGHYYGSKAGRQALREALEKTGLTSLTGGVDDPVARLGEGLASIDHICVGGIPASKERPEVWPARDELGARLTDHHGVVVTLGDGPYGWPKSRALGMRSE